MKMSLTARLAGIVCCTCLLLPSISQAKSFEEVKSAALHGDYQAQRNLAFGYTDMPYKEQRKNPILGCAWRIVILTSDLADDTDQMNYQLYCGRISKAEYDIAKTKAESLMRTLEKSGQ